MPDEAVQKEFHVLLFDEQKSSSITTKFDRDAYYKIDINIDTKNMLID